MLTDKQYAQIKDELDSCKSPLFFFHDDPDGLCSYLLLYRHLGEGHGIIVKTHPRIDDNWLRKVDEYQPDKVFILDIAVVEQDFIDGCKVPIVWIDHHGPYDRENVKYFNPRSNDRNSSPPVSYICYKAVDEDMWLGMAGCIADMYMPDFADEFRMRYPGLLPEGINAREAQFNSVIGRLARILSFVLKGTSTDAMKFAKLMYKVKTPYEILNKETEAGRKIAERYEQVSREYDVLVKEAKAEAGDDPVLLFIYPPSRNSFTGDLANELVYSFPDKVIIIGREKNGEYKLSLRSDRHNLPSIIEKSLAGLEGFGGGHEHAAGAVVKSEDFPKFLENLKSYAI
jgi:single-stranded DNA-specific DHH superfamily exonuclease